MRGSLLVHIVGPAVTYDVFCYMTVAEGLVSGHNAYLCMLTDSVSLSAA